MGVPAPRGVSASGRSPYWPDDKANAVVQGIIDAVGPTPPFAMYGPMNLWLWSSFNTELTVNAASLTAQVAAPGALAAGVSINSSLLPRGTVMSAFADPDATLVLPPLTFWCKNKPGTAILTNVDDTTWLLGATVNGPGAAGLTVDEIITPSVAATPDMPRQYGSVRLSGNVSEYLGITVDELKPFTFDIATSQIAAGVDADALFTGAPIVENASVQLERSPDGGATWIPGNIGSSGAIAVWTSATLGPLSITFGEPELSVLYRLNCLAITPTAGVALNYRISESGQRGMTLATQTL